MKKFKIYLDTSVISMLDDSLRGIITREFFDLTEQLGCQFVVSDVVRAEIESIPDKNKGAAILQFLKTLNCILLTHSEESLNLALKYVLDGVLTHNHFDDLAHVAYATVNQCDMIVSWNRKHIARLSKIQKLNACNIKNNYPPITIYTPEEFLTLYK